MPAFCFKPQKIDLRFCFFRIRFFGSLNTSSDTLYSQLTQNDSELHVCLSQRRFGDALNLLEKFPERSQSSRVVFYTSLVTKYSRSGFVDEARALFDIILGRNVVSFNAMLSGYLRCGRLSEGMRFFEDMPLRNVVSWTLMLCGLLDAGRVVEARRLFDGMPERNVVSWNAMVSGLIQHGEFEEARQIFDLMPVRNVASWNAMIDGYVENGRMGEARDLFQEMRERNVISWTSMISGYCRQGNVDQGYDMFCNAPERNVVCWTAMIGGFAWNGYNEEALLLFLEMKRSTRIQPNRETFISLAYACAGMGLRRLGKQLHAQLVIKGLVSDDYDGRLSKSLIRMYSELGAMDFAQSIFDGCLQFSNQSCNSMIGGYIQIGRLDLAENLFYKVPCRDKISWTSMIDGYFGIGDVSKACYLFHSMPEKDAIAWTTMIMGHVQNELFGEATCFFAEMRNCGVSPLSSTYAVLVAAAGATACLDLGRQFHGLTIKSMSKSDFILDNSLISMYAKVGEIHDAYRIFANMPKRDLISWNSMIMGFSLHGLANKALDTFKAMLESHIDPNSVTFLGVLSACGHTGLVKQGWELFDTMRIKYAIQPGLEHCISMVHLLGRAGKAKEAEEFVLSTPFRGNHAIWGALLGVCWFSERNADIGKRTARRLLEFDPMNASAHVLLCNIYAGSGQYEEEHMLRKEMGLKGVGKQPGCSWIQLGERVHVFLSGDRLPVQVAEMFPFLFDYIPEWD